MILYKGHVFPVRLCLGFINLDCFSFCLPSGIAWNFVLSFPCIRNPNTHCDLNMLLKLSVPPFSLLCNEVYNNNDLMVID
jgi:hypothetical protein